jgi:outer membrane protein assembly factor BamB
MRTGSILRLAAFVVVAPLAASAADWPQWRGPARNGVSPEKGLLREWPKAGPPLVWTYDKAGIGYSGPAVVGGKLYVLGARDGTDLVIALDGDGKELWTTKIGKMFAGNAYTAGPNATPTVDGEVLYALGSQGDLVCLALADGKERWRKNLPQDLGAFVNGITSPKPEQGMGWGLSWSPLVDGDRLVCTPGGKKGLFAALNKKTGDVLWQSKDVRQESTYSSPLVGEVGGVRQYVALTQDGAAGVDANTGDLLWEYRRENPFPDVVCPTPVLQGDKLYVTAWGAGAELIQLKPDGKKFKATPIYSERVIGNIQGGVVLVDGFVYGFHEKRNWACQDFATGEIKWEAGRKGVGNGQGGALVAADGLLFCLAEQGIAALVEASPEKYLEKGRFTLPQQSTQRRPNGRVWTVPVVADGHLYLRDQEFIFCYKVK